MPKTYRPSASVAPQPVQRAAPDPPSVPPGDADDAAAAVERLGPAIELKQAALDAGNSCVQCGLCLPACPTYLETGNEADSPRGRIRLMLGLHSGEVAHTDAAQTHLDRCLDCRACETACPSGVQYHTLIEDTRDKLATDRRDGGEPVAPLSRWQRRLFFHVFTKPQRLRAAIAAARAADKIGLRTGLRAIGVTDLFGSRVKRMEALLPIDAHAKVWPKPLKPFSPAGGLDLIVEGFKPPKKDAKRQSKARPTIAFFEGCVSQVMAGHVHQMAVELLNAAGADVVAPLGQQCCGAIHQHGGDPAHALKLAKLNIDAFLPDDGSAPDAIVSCTAGDGAMLRQYAELLADDPAYRERAQRFAALVRDVTEVLVDLGVGDRTPALAHPVAVTAAYHDACHLAHGQGVTAAPRTLLSRVPELTLIDLPESDVCCGAAGTYNLTQPEMAKELAHRKLGRFAATGAGVLVSANIGCTLHLRAAATERGERLRIAHPVELVHAAAFGRRASRPERWSERHGKNRAAR